MHYKCSRCVAIAEGLQSHDSTAMMMLCCMQCLFRALPLATVAPTLTALPVVAARLSYCAMRAHSCSSSMLHYSTSNKWLHSHVHCSKLTAAAVTCYCYTVLGNSCSSEYISALCCKCAQALIIYLCDTSVSTVPCSVTLFECRNAMLPSRALVVSLSLCFDTSIKCWHIVQACYA
jgi:hypothetical protein